MFQQTFFAIGKWLLANALVDIANIDIEKLADDACRLGNFDTVVFMWESKILPLSYLQANEFLPLQLACQKGNFDFVCFYWNQRPLTEQEMFETMVFLQACYGGDLQIVTFFASKFKLQTIQHFHDSFKAACERGHLSLVQFLWDYFRPNKTFFMLDCLECACRRGDLDMILFLLQKIPFEKNRKLLSWAIQSKKAKIIRFLWNTNRFSRSDMRSSVIESAWWWVGSRNN